MITIKANDTNTMSLGAATRRQADGHFSFGGRFLIPITVMVMILISATTKGHAADTSDGAARCRNLATVDLSNVPDAIIAITETKVVAETPKTIGFCEIRGYVNPNIGFRYRIPLANWTGRFIQIGCPGYCGSMVHIAGCDDPLRKGYACIVSDGGHRAAYMDSKWAYNNLPGMVDLFVRAPHVTAVAGKAIVERYHGQAPKKSYFWGCSGGCSQAMIEAQRFPWDFDGIIAGAATDWVWTEIYFLWANRALTDEAGKSRLTQQDLEVLHQAVVKKCDLNDGLKDGLIGDPRACGFEPSELLCTSGKKTGCLSETQADAVNKVYRGPVTSNGEPLPALPTAMRGSERLWGDFFAGPPDNPRYMYDLMGEAFRYFNVFHPAPGPTWKPEDFDFDRDYKRIGILENLLEPNNHDLRKFKAAGGKLLHHAGWNDTFATLRDVDYYETVERVMGGRKATQDFYRLFVMPGANHCSGGDGAWAVDYLGHMEAWVEKGEPPEKLVSSHIKVIGYDLSSERTYEVGRRAPFPFQVGAASNAVLDPAGVEFSRPVYPYPITVRYLGYGDPKDAASFGPVEPGKEGGAEIR